MYLVCGIHGSGKTEFVKIIEKQLGLKGFSDSCLILEKSGEAMDVSKKVNEISDNQKLLLSALEEIQETEYILDGHLCLLDDCMEIKKISVDIFKQMKIERMYLVINKPEKIMKRMKQRDNIIWSADFVERFQQMEIDYAYELADQLSIPLKIFFNNIEVRDCAAVGNKNIILPIHPCYAEKILASEKKYEYRKKLCQKEIKKIYIYATAPIKKIIGEVEVLEKRTQNKEVLWKETVRFSGITKDFYDLYFSRQAEASAYCLGAVKRYLSPLPLQDLGIDYVPQSFIYYGDIQC